MTRYVHTNLVARDWKTLAAFYVDVFQCEPLAPERDLSGDWLDRASGLEDARLRGIHLRLPGYGAHGPTLEIFAYDSSADRPEPVANRFGFGHIAFAVDDVAATLDRLLRAGGTTLGEVVHTHIDGAGDLTLVYARDPESNIVELQCWGSRPTGRTT